MNKVLALVFSILAGFQSFSQGTEVIKTHLAGVYQGKTLFIQNPYNRESKTFCVEKILLNNEPLILNYKLSALKLDFDGFDLFTPVNITIVHEDTVCSPIIINSEAVLFHTIYRFSSLSLSDSAMSWTTKGERGVGSFSIEKLENGFWNEVENMVASGVYESASYTYLPILDEGANKYRVKYEFPSGSRAKYIYSEEIDYDHYPVPVEFQPHSAKTRLYLSRITPYEIYDDNSVLVLRGQGLEIDVTVLRQGRYVIYFNGKDPGTFIKE
jgi:hypothetical protein